MKNKPILGLSIILIAVFGLSLRSPLPVQAGDSLAPDQRSVIEEIIAGFVNSESGYIFQDGRLFLTKNGGTDWQDITPQDLSGKKVNAIEFISSENGFILFSTSDPNFDQSFSLAHTNDGGQTWTIKPLNLPFADDQVMNYERASLDFLDLNQGWISLKVTSSSNFSIGVLFVTKDGGDSWALETIPLGEPVQFISESIGWVAGGPAGNQLYRSNDGGKSWKQIELPELLNFEHIKIEPPRFFDPLIGWLPVFVANGNSTRIIVFSTTDGGVHWSMVASQDTNLLSTATTLTSLNSDNRVFSFIDNHDIVSFDGTNFSRLGISGEDINYASQLFMFGESVGYMEIKKTECAGTDGSTINCSSTFKLIKTNDNGQTWAEIMLPATHNPILVETSVLPVEPEMAIQGLTQIFTGQGFDTCEIPTLAQLQAWKTSSPYGAINLYIGGNARACSNAALTGNYVSQASQQGWKFIPTWVGPQAPCFSGRSEKMSSDPKLAYIQGVNEAHEAVSTLKSLGLTYPDGTGSVVYYDMEYYSGDSSCYSAVNSFMNGWTNHLHALGNTSGIYGSSCGSHLTSYFSQPNPPDVIWPAAWYHASGEGTYDANATVWDIPCISNSVYTGHKRIRQYEGGHYETYGGVKYNIDSNVIDGVVAISNNGTIQASCPATIATASYVCEPILIPTYSNDSCNTFWYPIPGFNGFTALLTENAQSSETSSNSGMWTPSLQSAGVYQVEAYIANHGIFTTHCNWGDATLGADTSSAKYFIHAASGDVTVTKDQLPLSNRWLNLGQYTFNAGTEGYVTLSNLTDELRNSTNVSFSAMKFSLVSYLIPTISSIFPLNAAVGSTGITLTVNGTNFVDGSVVRWNGNDRPTTFVNGGQLTAVIPAEDLLSIGTAIITVYNPEPGGGTSGEVTFSITIPDPSLTSLTPSSILSGSPSISLTVNGNKFMNGAEIYWNGEARTTNFVSATQLTTQINSADVASVAVAQITVKNPGSAASNPLPFSVYTFADVLPSAWYWRWVEGFYAQGITTGCAANPLKYCPDRQVTRAEMAVFLLRAKNGLTTPTPTTTGMFADVPVAGKAWMQPWIEQFYNEGITTGCAAGPLKYCPERQVTRAEMAVFVLRAVHGNDYVPPAATGVFSDVPVAGKEWMQPWIEQFYREGITTGCASNPLRYCPEQSVTRAEMATFINRAFGYPQLP